MPVSTPRDWLPGTDMIRREFYWCDAGDSVVCIVIARLPRPNRRVQLLIRRFQKDRRYRFGCCCRPSWPSLSVNFFANPNVIGAPRIGVIAAIDRQIKTAIALSANSRPEPISMIGES